MSIKTNKRLERRILNVSSYSALLKNVLIKLKQNIQFDELKKNSSFLLKFELNI